MSIPTGIDITPDVLQSWNKIQGSKPTKRYAIYTIVNEKVVVYRESNDVSFESFSKSLQEQPCYAALFFSFQDTDGLKKSKVIFSSWVPEDADRKTKMLIAGSREEVKSIFSGNQGDMQLFDESDVVYTEFLDKARGRRSSEYTQQVGVTPEIIKEELDRLEAENAEFKAAGLSSPYELAKSKGSA